MPAQIFLGFPFDFEICFTAPLFDIPNLHKAERTFLKFCQFASKIIVKCLNWVARARAEMDNRKLLAFT